MRISLRRFATFFSCVLFCLLSVTAVQVAQAADNTYAMTASFTVQPDPWTTTAGAQTTATLTASYSIVPGSQPDGPGSKTTYVWSVESIEFRATPESALQTLPTAGIIPFSTQATPQVATVTTNFTTTGVYDIKVKVFVRHTPGTGPDFVAEKTNTLTQTVTPPRTVAILGPAEGVAAEIMSGAVDDEDHTIVLFAKISEATAGVSVNFEVEDNSPSTTKASLSAATAITDAEGIAQIVLKSSNTDGEDQSVKVKAWILTDKSDVKEVTVALLQPGIEYFVPEE